jgi:hypothetical protein
LVKAGVATAEHSEGGYRDTELHGWHERTRFVLHVAREYRRRKEVEAGIAGSGEDETTSRTEAGGIVDTLVYTRAERVYPLPRENTSKNHVTM